MSYLRIEDVKLEDFDRLDEIEHRTFTHPFSKETYIDLFLNHPYTVFFKLCDGDEIIGFIVLWMIFDEVQIISISIDPSVQRRGYGQFLLLYVMAFVRNQKCKHITLEVRISNEKAIALYKKNGFAVVAVRKQYYPDGEDAYLMKCDLC